jgi:hypothetical protein
MATPGALSPAIRAARGQAQGLVLVHHTMARLCRKWSMPT